MAFNVNTGFDNETRLVDIRKEVLNPMAVRVTDLRNKMDEVRPLAKSAFTSADKDLVNKTITLHSDTGDSVVDLDGMFREGSDLEVTDKAGTSIQGVSKVHFNDSTIVNSGGGEVEVTYDWDNLVKTHQDVLSIGKNGQVTTYKPKALFFKGTNVDVAFERDIATVTIPEPVEFSGKIGAGTAKVIDEIHLIGNVAGSTFDGTTLQINIPDGGSGGGGISNQNFKGFFSSLGDIESQVSDPLNNRSIAYAQVSYAGGLYYDPYFYVNDKWQRLKPEPALTYSPATSQTAGVYSIKPDARITIDSQGQLDLSGLGAKSEAQYFHGFFETQALLESDVPNPVVDRSFAYVRHSTTGAWLGKLYKTVDGTNKWQNMAPLSATTLLEDSGIANAKPIYGIYNKGHWDVDDKGIMSLKPTTAETAVEITSYKGGASVTGSFNTIQYKGGKSNVTLDASAKKLVIEHPQQVIQYDSNFESSHNSMDYEGNIFYDETSRCWMGWGVPEASGGVDHKWTKIAHPKMSDEVKDLSRRLPRKAPNVTPGILGDAPSWEYNGWTYVKKDDTQLPEEFRERCGAYFITVIQDVTDDTPRPKERYQICYADEAGATSYVRRWKRTDSTGEYGWQPWIKISMSAKDISDHNTNHGSHRDSFKFYKAGTLDMTWKRLKDKNWYIGDSDLLLLADSDGVSLDGETTIKVPYTGTFRFSGRLDMDGWGTTTPYQKPQLFIYVYKTVGSSSSIIAEFSYNHTDHNKIPPPLQWKSSGIQLNEGDKIHFEVKAFNATLDTSYPDLRFIPNRTFFVMEDFGTTAGSRIAETFRRTIGSVNAHYDVGINVHYGSGGTGTPRVYGTGVTAKATDMSKIKG